MLPISIFILVMIMVSMMACIGLPMAKPLVMRVVGLGVCVSGNCWFLVFACISYSLSIRNIVMVVGDLEHVWYHSCGR